MFTVWPITGQKTIEIRQTTVHWYRVKFVVMLQVKIKFRVKCFFSIFFVSLSPSYENYRLGNPQKAKNVRL